MTKLLTAGQAGNFINLVYLDLLNRPADSSAYSAFVSLLVKRGNY